LLHAGAVETIRNIVFMGMGEPLHNYPAVLASLKAMTDTKRW
jgi:adenine C2-methylase RlmN of 23S rRNA A2503 and tRNA A37